MNIRLYIIIAAMCIACEEGDPGPVIKSHDTSRYDVPGIFVLNEGNFGRGNGSVSFYSVDSGKIYSNIFFSANKRSPGDIPYSMSFTGDTAFIVVNNSGKVEAVNLSDMSVITTITGMTSPRYLLNLGNDFAYISDLYSDSITIMNTKELRTAGFINLGRSSEMMAGTGSKVYVASWSGDSVITVISTTGHTVMKTITVGKEPESLVLDKNGILWVLCSGGYMGEELPSLSSVDTNTDIVLKRFTFPSGSYPASLNMNNTGDTLYYVNGGVYRMSVEENQLPQIPLIAGNNRRFYRVEAGAGKGCIFVTDAGDYQRNGFMLEYSTTGVLKKEFEVGIIPGSMAFRETYIDDK